MLAAMGTPMPTTRCGSVVGWSSTEADVDRLLEVLPGIIERFRGLRSA